MDANDTAMLFSPILPFVRIFLALCIIGILFAFSFAVSEMEEK